MSEYNVPEESEIVTTPGDVRDLVLQDLVGIVNRFPASAFGITLFVGGSVVTGMLISAQEYFERYASVWREALKETPDVAERIANGWAALGSKHANEAQENPRGPFHFVHLRDALILTGDTLYPSSGGFLWRGRISQVAGFSIGVLATGR